LSFEGNDYERDLGKLWMTLNESQGGDKIVNLRDSVGFNIPSKQVNYMQLFQTR